jgi:4-amino-4-deoxy-L-arabinose transferase-like glycosyltransferase
MTRERHFALGAAALVIAALALRFHQLGHQELWLDEAFTLELAGHEEFARAVRREYSPPLYYLLQRGWVALFGESEAAFRSLSALLGAAFVGAAIGFGRTLFGATAGLWTGALAALAPLHVYYSQEARPYALLALAVLASHGALWRAARVGTGRAWLAFSACTLLALSTHYFAALVLVPAALLIPLRAAEPAAARLGRRYAGALALGVVPWLVWFAWSFFVHPHPQGGHPWIRNLWEELPPALAIPKSLEVLLLGSQAGLLPGFLKQFTQLEFPAALRGLGLLLLVALLAAAVSPWGDGRTGLARRKAWLLGLLLLPLLTLWLGSFVRPYYVVARYDLVALPPYLLLLGFGLAKLQRRGRAGMVAAGLVAALLFAVLGTKLWLYYRAPAALGPSARVTALAIDTSVGRGDLVLFSHWRGKSVHYYLRRLGWTRRGSRCEHAQTGRSFGCANLSFDDQTTVLDLDQLDRIGYSLEIARADLRALLEPLDPSANDVWLERRQGPPAWRRLVGVLGEELARAGFHPAPSTPQLRQLRISRFAGGD